MISNTIANRSQHSCNLGLQPTKKYRKHSRYMCCTPKATVWCEFTVLNLVVMFLSFFAGKFTHYSHSFGLLEELDKTLPRDRNPMF